ncbi:hypothetical protein [Actinoplanes derwentensis]|nr:hypothetical protein [Actinoplanes derwentensis]
MQLLLFLDQLDLLVLPVLLVPRDLLVLIRLCPVLLAQRVPRVLRV